MTLTNRQIEILEFLTQNPDEDIMLEGRLAYFGNNKTSTKMIYSLIRLCVISQDQSSDLRFGINETGRKALLYNKNNP